MTDNGQPDFRIHTGKHLATIEPLNPNAIKFNMLNVAGVEPNGWYTIHMDYLEDKVRDLQSENFIVEVR